MRTLSIRTLIRIGLLIIFIGLLGITIAAQPSPSQAAPEATAALTFVNVSAPDIRCIFDNDCTIFVDDEASNFTFSDTTGVSYLQSRMFPRGEAGTPGVGLFGYEYRIDMTELVGIGTSRCVTELTIDFGPIVKMDYDDDGTAEEHGYVITSGGIGSIAPLAITQTGGEVTFDFANNPICGDESIKADDGTSTFYFGMASPFRDHEITAVIKHNDPGTSTLSQPAHAPDYTDDVTLQVVPNEGPANSTVQLIGSGYIPGDYTGSILWDSTPDTEFQIPDGGAFTISYTIPSTATLGSHIITACAKDPLQPCTTFEFEQEADAGFTVTDLYLPNQVFLPMIIKDGNGGGSEPEPFSYVINSDVKPSQEKLPSFNDGKPRPLTAVEDPKGTVSTFVANEIVLQTDDKNALDDFLSRTDGEILVEMDPKEYDVDGLKPLYLIRVNLSTADTGDFTSNIESLADSDIGSFGEYAFGSTEGVEVFSIAADEAMDGMTVGINWVSDTGAIPSSSNEAASGADPAYSANAYNWTHFAAGTTQDIGVPEAWTLMYRGGKLGNTVDVAILDGGFYPNADFPSTTTYLNIFPFDPRNVDGVDGSAPFHGTDVLQTVAAVGDDGNGIVGVAEPIVHPIALYTSYDFFVSIGSVLMARGAGAEIMNMSYSAEVPSIFGFTVWPFEATTAAVRASGALLFASAGNDNKNVDGEDCIFGRICWEHTWHTPCENAGVICVGGLGWDSQRKAGGTSGGSGSNYGRENVDIFAPYTVYRGQSPSFTGGNSNVGFINGTSFSSPYAASVAALIWASDPSLNADQVWAIMRDTAHTSPDRNVNLYVNAYNAVLSAIGVGVSADLTSPVDGVDYDLGYAVHMAANVGFVSPADGIPMQVQWYVDGGLHSSTTYNLGAGSHTRRPETAVTGLSEGSHTIMIRVTADGEVSESSATFNVVNTAPTATIDQPSSGAAFCPGETVILRGSSFDLNEYSGLPNSAYVWNSSIDGYLGTGATVSTSSLSEGVIHTITLRVTDSQGLWDEDTITVDILDSEDSECEDVSPTAWITSPANGYRVMVDSHNGTWNYKQITFTGIVHDVEDPDNTLTVQWRSDQQGILGTSIPDASGNVSITSNIELYECFGTEHIITLRVTDSFGNVTEDQIVVTVFNLC